MEHLERTAWVRARCVGRRLDAGATHGDRRRGVPNAATPRASVGINRAQQQDGESKGGSPGEQVEAGGRDKSRGEGKEEGGWTVGP